MTSLDSAFLAPYSPKDNEDRLYEKWNESGFFNPDNCEKNGISSSELPPFSLVLPPPNVTGTLHMGHAAMLAIQDTLVRFNRMQFGSVLFSSRQR